MKIRVPAFKEMQNYVYKCLLLLHKQINAGADERSGVSGN